MTAWAGLTGMVNAQAPAADPPRSAPRVEVEPAPLPFRATLPLRGARLIRPQPLVTPAARQVETKEVPPPQKPTSPSDAPVPKAPTTAGPAAVPTSPEIVYDVVPGYAAHSPRPGAPSGRAWTNLEWLVWATSGQHVPPAITTSPFGTPQNLAGALTTPGTINLFPTDRANNEFRGGFRANAGYWFDDARTLGIEGDFFFVQNSKKGRTEASDANGFPIIARPFTDAVTGESSALLVAFPGGVRGVADVRAENFAIGGGFHFLYDLLGGPCGRLDAMLGFRYLGVFDEITFEQDSTSLVAGSTFGQRLQILDRFNAKTNFYGVVLGLSGERKVGFWFFGARGSLALGGVRQHLRIDGRTVITPPNGQPEATFRGLYAQASNIGGNADTAFAVLPEIGLRFGVQLTESGRFYLGYNWMYLNNVIRAGDQIDTQVNTEFLLPPGGTATGPQRPALLNFKTTDYWLQGLCFGMEIKF
jgi:hypothetical protein